MLRNRLLNNIKRGPASPRWIYLLIGFNILIIIGLSWMLPGTDNILITSLLLLFGVLFIAFSLWSFRSKYRKRKKPRYMKTQFSNN